MPDKDSDENFIDPNVCCEGDRITEGAVVVSSVRLLAFQINFCFHQGRARSRSVRGWACPGLPCPALASPAGVNVANQ